MKTMRRILSQRRGSIMVIAASALVMIMGFSALVIDVGVLYTTRVQLHNLADAAALAGVQELPDNSGAAFTSAQRYARLNGNAGDVLNIQVLNGTTVSVMATRNVPLFFGRVLGLTSWDVQGAAAARISPASGLSGMMPFALEKQNLEYGRPYTIKVGAGPEEGSYKGNFHVLANTDRGGQDYKNNIINGCNWPIDVGSWVATEPGDMIGPTKQGVNYRYDQDPTATFATVTEGSPRIMVVPVVDSLLVNGRNEVQVVGFAAMFLESRTNGRTVTGSFMQMVTAGNPGDGTANYGVYASRLIPYPSAN